MPKNQAADFVFEAAALNRLYRTGWQILGTGLSQESVAGHSFLVCVISFLLSIDMKVDREKVLLMGLFHDFEEARTGDVYKLADLYTITDKKKAVKDSFSPLKNSKHMLSLVEEYNKGISIEAKLVHDADTLALCVVLKQLMENGNVNAGEWLDSNLKSLKTLPGQKLGKIIKKTNSQNWWKKERIILHQSLANK